MMASVLCPRCNNVNVVGPKDVKEKVVNLKDNDEVMILNVKCCECDECKTEMIVQIDNKHTKHLLELLLTSSVKAKNKKKTHKAWSKVKDIDKSLTEERNELMRNLNGKVYYDGIEKKEIICAKSQAVSMNTKE